MTPSDKIQVRVAYTPRVVRYGIGTDREAQVDSKLRHIVRLRAATGAGLKDTKDRLEAALDNRWCDPETGEPHIRPSIWSMSAEQFGRLVALTELDNSGDIVNLLSVDVTGVNVVVW